jgi:hypothetical protein
VLNALRDHEIAVMNDVKATSQQDIQTLGARGHDLINQLFLRAVELMLLTLVSCSLVAWILLRWFVKRRPERAEAERVLDRAA